MLVLQQQFFECVLEILWGSPSDTFRAHEFHSNCKMLVAFLLILLCVYGGIFQKPIMYYINRLGTEADIRLQLLDFSVGKNPPANAGDGGSIPGLGRSLGRENCNPLQYSHLGNPMDRGAWRAIAHRRQKSWIQLSD